MNISETLKNILAKEKNSYVVSRSSTLQPDIVTDILKKIEKQHNLNTQEEAIAVLALLFQQGGTARSCDGNMAVKIFDQEFKLSNIRKILKNCSCAKGERKLARSLANEIKEIALIMELPGNLYNKIQKQNLSKKFTLEEKIWLSDFQSDNENCPAELRTLILETFKKKKN
jgi:hypothetical protein